MTLRKQIIITAQCTATIEETWTFVVPDEWEPGDNNENVEMLLENTPEDCTYVSVTDHAIGDERDRTFTNIEGVKPRDNARC